MRRLGLALLIVASLLAAGAPFVAPHASDTAFRDLLNAPPTVIRVRDNDGHWRRPFISPLVLANRLEQRYDVDTTVAVPLAWFTDGHLVQSADDDRAPLMLLGSDTFGRDVFSRLIYGARLSLGLAVVASLGAVLLGASAGAAAGYAGGALDDLLMRSSEFVLVLPAIYVALALRAVLPLVLEARVIFALLAGIFAVVGSPFVARGVRTIVRSERQLEYAAAARSLGASHLRLLTRHLLPATWGFIGVQLTVLVPAFIVAEATLSYVGLGFPDPVASWGAMLYSASNVSAIARFPWLLSPAGAIFAIVLALNLLLQGRSEGVGVELGR